MTQDFPPWLAYGAAFCLLLLIIALCLAMKKESQFHNISLPLFERLNAQNNEPLTRRDIESTWTDANRWICPVCEFSNSSKQVTCVLCGTAISLSPMHLKLKELNTRQRCAKQRMEWSRTVGLDGKLYWTKTIKTEEKEEQQTNTNSNTSTDPSDHGFVARLSNLRLTLTDCQYADPSVSSAGYVINSQDLEVLENVANMPFPEKYNWFLEQTDTLLKPWSDGRLKLRVHREHVLVESMEQLLGVSLEHIHMPLRIEFIGESGIDAGGLEREWIALLSEKLFDDRTGLFKRCKNGSYRINPNSREASVDHLLYFKGVGRWLGRILLEGQLLQATLCLPIFKHMLGVPLTFSDLEFVDSQVYQSMLWVRACDHVESLELNFTVTEEESFEVIELKAGGQHIAVTQENKEEYLLLRMKYLVLNSFSAQLQSLMEGLFQVVAQELIMVFDYQELELLLCGMANLDMEDWRMHTQVSDELVGSHVLDWFWEIVESMSVNERRRLLQYATGSSRVPVQGFKGLTSYDGRICFFTLKSMPFSDTAYPRAHTCFNRIDLPMYKTKQQVEQVLYLVTQLETTGFTDE